MSAGTADIWLPDEVYSVTSDVAAGDFQNALRTDNSVMTHVIEVEVAAGGLSLRPQG